MVTRGRPWGREEEKELIGLVKAGESLDVIAGKLGKTLDSVVQKMRRLGLIGGQSVAPRPPPSSSTCDIDLPDELPTAEDAVKILGGAMLALTKPGMSKADLEKCRALADVAWKYKIAVVDLVDYKGIEKENVEWRKKYEEKAAKEANVPTRGSGKGTVENSAGDSGH